MPLPRAVPGTPPPDAAALAARARAEGLVRPARVFVPPPAAPTPAAPALRPPPLRRASGARGRLRAAGEYWSRRKHAWRWTRKTRP